MPEIEPPSDSRKFDRLRDELYERSPESRERVAEEVERLRAIVPPNDSHEEWWVFWNAGPAAGPFSTPGEALSYASDFSGEGKVRRLMRMHPEDDDA